MQPKSSQVSFYCIIPSIRNSFSGNLTISICPRACILGCTRGSSVSVHVDFCVIVSGERTRYGWGGGHTPTLPPGLLTSKLCDADVRMFFRGENAVLGLENMPFQN